VDWFRMYGEFATDPKVQMMSEADQRRFVMLLCLRCSNGGVTLHETEVAFQLRISNEEWATSKALFVSKGLIDEDCQPTAWDRRQFVSDSSRERVAAHRAKKKQVRNVTVTPPDTDTDTDTYQDQKPVATPRAKSRKFDPLTVKPANVSQTAWADWCQHRREIHKPLTAKSCEQQAKALEGHATPDQVLANSISNGWTGIFPDKVNNVHQLPPRRNGNEPDFDSTAWANGLLVNP
jgi:hypothetical protein